MYQCFLPSLNFVRIYLKLRLIIIDARRGRNREFFKEDKPECISTGKAKRENREELRADVRAATLNKRAKMENCPGRLSRCVAALLDFHERAD